MPKKFNEKKIKKKDLIHPRSRKADQVNRAKLRKQKLEGAHEKLMIRKNATVLRLCWFQEILKGSENAPTAEDLNEWIKMYIDRFDEEIENLVNQIRPHRPLPPKLVELKMAKKQETDEFCGAGFEMAQILEPAAFKKFLEWDGTFGSMHLIKLVRYKKIRDDLNDEMSE